MDATLVKGGETLAEISLNRSSKGLTVSVKTHPIIEEFARGLSSNNSPVPITLMGRHWHQIGDQPLMVYEIDPSLFKVEQVRTEDGFSFRVDRAGVPLIHEDGTLTMGFMRLAGISDGSGVTFGVSGVYTLDALKLLRDRILVASRKYYVHYIRPVDLSVTMSTQELQL
jgi:hypothetical protein